MNIFNQEQLYKTVELRFNQMVEEGEIVFDSHTKGEYIDRYERELLVIDKLGIQPLLAIAADAMKIAQTETIIAAALGPVCGCLVAYLLGITEVDPIEYGLIFERFASASSSSCGIWLYTKSLFQGDSVLELADEIKYKWGDYVEVDRSIQQSTQDICLNIKNSALTIYLNIAQLDTISDIQSVLTPDVYVLNDGRQYRAEDYDDLALAIVFAKMDKAAKMGVINGTVFQGASLKLQSVLDSVLKESNGRLVYQEQLMNIIAMVAGCSLQEANSLRLAMSKRKCLANKNYQEAFVQRAVKNYFSDKEAAAIFNFLNDKAMYLYCKAFYVSYAQTLFAYA